MKRVISILAMMLLFAASAQANLLSNGGFETGDTTDWWTWAEAAPDQSLTVVDTLASEGTYSMESFSASSTWSAQFGASLAVVEGEQLTLTFDYYAVTAGWGSLGVNMDYYDDGGKHWLGWTEVFNESSAPVEGAWETVTIVADVPDGFGAYSIDLKVEVANWATVNFDNFVATQVPEPATLSLLVLGSSVLLRRRTK